MKTKFEKNQLVKSLVFIAIIITSVSCKDGRVNEDSAVESIQPDQQPTQNSEFWEQPLRWAYAGVSEDIQIPVPSDESERQVPGSDLVLPFARMRDLFNTPDWHPQDHPEMPSIVAVGRKPDVFACGTCHRANGTGGPENASIDGLSAAYIKQQIADFKNGDRRNPVPSRRPFEAMVSLSHALTEDEIDAAANYFSRVKPLANIRVVETGQVPHTYERGWHLAVLDDEKFEPIGARIIEVPADIERFVNRDSRVEFIAYVPVGSIEKGERVAASGIPTCASCHGEGLKGMGDIPRLAGRSPTYLIRQLYDFQTGFRSGPNGAVMTAVSKTLNSEDMIALAAYIASLKP